jgi:hypothetical protein
LSIEIDDVAALAQQLTPPATKRGWPPQPWGPAILAVLDPACGIELVFFQWIGEHNHKCTTVCGLA